MWSLMVEPFESTKHPPTTVVEAVDPAAQDSEAAVGTTKEEVAVVTAVEVATPAAEVADINAIKVMVVAEEATGAPAAEEATLAEVRVVTLAAEVREATLVAEAKVATTTSSNSRVVAAVVDNGRRPALQSAISISPLLY